MEVYSAPSEIAARLAAVAVPIRLVVFTQTFGCDTCYEARQVADQMASLSEQITVEEHNLVLDKDEVSKYQVDQVPVIAVVAERDVGIRYYGVPAGFEVESLVSAIEVVAGLAPAVSVSAQSVLDALGRDVRISVFVTPT
jgi:alkyl hydroperoxide reductase subunit AhpF